MSKVQPNANDAVKWQEPPSVKGRKDDFMLVYVSTNAVLKSWRFSLFSHEWLDSEGHILSPDQMVEKERKKRDQILRKITQEDKLEYPVLGIGLQDNIEIGAGRAVFLTLSAEGYQVLPVYIFKSCLEDFQEYLA